MINDKKIIVVIPAYNTEKTLEKSIKAIPEGSVDEIIVVDDGSRDKTSEIAKRLGVHLVVHEKNKGYGGAQKTGYREALNMGADVAVMVHSDFQYDPSLVPEMVKKIALGEADVCFGSRMHNKGDARKGGMPLWRFVANRALTILEDSFFRLGLTEYHTGYRAYGRNLLTRIPFEKNSNNYVFDTEMFAEISLGKFRVYEIPIPTRYTEESKSPSFYKSLEYGMMTLGVLAKFTFQKLGIKKYENFDIK
ncbi:MAG: hypothetical protein A2725_01055 [Candidatus Magasanikbacteria bacterium RIFCSPHIGHO2_01_FULL_33_34]|uniref:Glycosyltransferase 2-like domain-containing protein n=1 Tax=Candidatus Magasanikbacteria bacterium RIFCSPHIGHO2_01_FULL_33_34 TaxID=1798671 RepID=A0A1F6LJ88_9BACT|nr:MAG: hypothetical protein A2725_01055 [Candidatus Magasanikbacteria bacterium RIFCSPHIGHO2_01_FULL_33_34]OGH65343.1 MAG: hypothetical protein A3B83_04715 [Candidatus Magasanikbacteria bacterium RIFCSPHIGHO2_02_FULL_33_17]OGH76119.1 MAG: hypothetical protein A3A89_01635 [Candidatus Magasanikbacteria bacterium RIFCSPLOWO2_01_FULL_33_34]OGH81079.1 MAG: hypothetical protein A3F93_02865 [Candidatus Magasanikbacteria bacterium RIFCSPLOWO2_12_FULL_34_7]